MNENKVVVLYHANCMDGLGAKYAAWKRYGDEATYIPVQYGKPAPEVQEIKSFSELKMNDIFRFDIKGDGSFYPECVKITDAGYVNVSEGRLKATRVEHIPPATEVKTLPDVYILDFSYKPDILDQIAAKSNTLTILDHHKTAQEDLDDYPGAHFDMTKSGAVLAWEHFHIDEEIPLLLQYVQDRDLWTWKLSNTANVIAGLELARGDMTAWDQACRDEDTLEYLTSAGKAITQHNQIKIENALYNVIVKPYKGYKVGVMNTTTLGSEIGNAICKDAQLGVDFSMTYFFDKLGVPILSLRSIGDFDVSVIAKELQGGGHKNASGCRVTPEFLSQLYNEEL